MTIAPRSRRRALAAIFILALAMRVLFIWVQARYHIFDIYFVASDSRLYEMLAHGLLSGAGYSMLGKPTAVVTPGYPLFLAFLHQVGIESALAVGFAQSIIGAMTCLVIAALGGHLRGPRASIVAGLLSAVYVHLIFWTGYVLTETLFVFLAVASLLALVRWRQRVGSYSRAIVAGIFLGMGSLTRPHLLLFGGLAAAYITLRDKRFDQALWPAVAMVVTIVVVFSPWVVRNYRAFGVLLAGSTLSGEVLYQGYSDDATGGSGGYLDARDFKRLDLPADMSELEVNRAYSQAAREFIRHHPERLLPLAVKKWINMWRPTYEGASSRNFLIFAGSYLFVVVFSVIGVANLRATEFGPVARLLSLYVAFFMVLHMVVPGMIRYRLPVEPVLIVFATVGLIGAFDWLSRTDRSTAGLTSAA